MIETWVDELTRVWEIPDGKGGQVRSYRLFEKDEFPAEVPLDSPTALTFVDDVDTDYSQGGPTILMWHGTTVFHLTPNLDRSRIPYLSTFFSRILVAAATNMKLSGKVNYFALEPSNSISVVVTQYGNEAPHLGIEVKWMVKENVVLTVGDPSL